MDIQREKNSSASIIMMLVTLNGKRKWNSRDKSRRQLSIDSTRYRVKDNLFNCYFDLYDCLLMALLSAGPLPKSTTFTIVWSDEPSEFSKEEVEELARPCLNMLNRLTYEVTEIALDLPGINLEF